MEFLKSLEEWQDSPPLEKELVNKPDHTLPETRVLQMVEIEANRRLFVKFLKNRAHVVAPSKMLENFALFQQIEHDSLLMEFIIEKEHGDTLRNYLISTILSLNFCADVDQTDLYCLKRQEAKQMLKRLKKFHKGESSLKNCEDCFYFFKFLQDIERVSPFGEIPWEEANKFCAKIKALLVKAKKNGSNHFQDEFNLLFKTLNDEIVSLKSKLAFFIEIFIPFFTKFMEAFQPVHKQKLLKRYLSFILKFLPLNSFRIEVTNKLELYSGTLSLEADLDNMFVHPSIREAMYERTVLSNDEVKAFAEFVLVSFEVHRKGVSSQKIKEKFLLIVSIIAKNYFAETSLRDKFEDDFSMIFCEFLNVIEKKITDTQLAILCQSFISIKEFLKEENSIKWLRAFELYGEKYSLEKSSIQRLFTSPSSLLPLIRKLHPIARTLVPAGSYEKKLFHFSTEQLTEKNFLLTFLFKVDCKSIKLGIYRNDENHKLSLKNLISHSKTKVILEKKVFDSSSCFRGAIDITEPCLIYFIFDNSSSLIKEKHISMNFQVLTWK